MEKHYFTLEEANALLPFLSEKLMELKLVKEKIESLVKDVEKRGWDLDRIFSNEQIPDEQRPYRQKFEELGDQVNDYLHDIQEKGPVVKDIEMGLVDFMARIQDEESYLCWKLGESEVQHWHGINEGFANRKSLFEREILENVTVLH